MTTFKYQHIHYFRPFVLRILPLDNTEKYAEFQYAFKRVYSSSMNDGLRCSLAALIVANIVSSIVLVWTRYLWKLSDSSKTTTCSQEFAFEIGKCHLFTLWIW